MVHSLPSPLSPPSILSGLHYQPEHLGFRYGPSPVLLFAAPVAFLGFKFDHFIPVLKLTSDYVFLKIRQRIFPPAPFPASQPHCPHCPSFPMCSSSVGFSELLEWATYFSSLGALHAAFPYLQCSFLPRVLPLPHPLG